MNEIGDLNFEKERVLLTPEQYTAIVESIRKELSLLS
jgi:hypothetical protein